MPTLTNLRWRCSLFQRLSPKERQEFLRWKLDRLVPLYRYAHGPSRGAAMCREREVMGARPWHVSDQVSNHCGALPFTPALGCLVARISLRLGVWPRSASTGGLKNAQLAPTMLIIVLLTFIRCSRRADVCLAP